MPFRFPPVRRAARVLLGLLAALAIGVALFDWNWFRHPLERYLIHRSHREIRIGDLHVDLRSPLEPTVRVRDVYVENATWADRRPAAVVGEASVTFSLVSVLEGFPVISRVVLVDADVDLEWQAGGLRNWRLLNPAYVGLGRVMILRMEPHRTRIRFIRRDLDFEVVATASDDEGGANGPRPDAAHPLRIAFNGEFQGSKFSGEVRTGPLLGFMETGETFPMRGHASTGKSRLEIDGMVADVLKRSTVDAKMHLAGPSLSGLHPFIRAALPVSRPYELEAHVRQAGRVTSFDAVRGRIGNTDVAGTFSVDLGAGRPMLRAALHSESADLSDLMALAGAGRLTDRAGDKGVAAVDEAGPVRGVAPQGVSPRGGPQRLFPDRVFDGERLKTLDAHVSLQAKRLSAAALPELESLSLTADLHEGVLALKPIDLGLAGGHVVGSLGLDGRQQLLSMRAKMELKGIRLEKLLARLAQGARSAGPLDGRIELKGQGDSVARILARSTGSVELSLEGGGISNLLDAKLGLNGGKLLRLMIAGDRAIGINRALAAFDFHEGVGTSKTILLDTDQTRTEGAGIVDLRDETVDLLLTPHPKKPGLFSLRASIRVHGPLRKPAFSLRRKADDATAQAVDPGAGLRVTFGSIRGPQQRRQPSP